MRDINHGLTVIHSAIVDDVEHKIRSNTVTPELVRYVNLLYTVTEVPNVLINITTLPKLTMSDNPISSSICFFLFP
jgi:hypothetical protein